MSAAKVWNGSAWEIVGGALTASVRPDAPSGPMVGQLWLDTDELAQGQGNGPYVCTSTTRPGSPVVGMQIYETDTNRLYTYTGTAWRMESEGATAAWTSFTPTWGGVFAIGNGTSIGRYKRIGNTVHFFATLTLGSTSAVGGTGAGAGNVAVPWANVKSLGPVTVQLFQHGNTWFTGVPLMTSEPPTATTIAFFATGASYGAAVNISGAVPWTWAATDMVSVQATYEVG